MNIPSAEEAGQWVIMGGYALIGGAAYLLARMLLQEQAAREAQESLEESRDRKASNALVKITRPFFTQYVVPLIRGRPFWDNQRKIFRRKLISSGLRDELTPDEFISFKFFLILFFPIVGTALKMADMLDLSWSLVLGSGVAGWFYPDFWVNGRVAKRQKQILRSMPFIVDLLALSTEAGLDFVGAIAKVAEKATASPLVDEFSQVLREIKVGSSRADALREMAARINMSEINSFVAILVSAEQMGASIGKILRQQSDQIRVTRILAAEKAGAAATQKLLIPLMVFFLPAVFIMIFGPFVLNMVNGN